MSGRGPNRHADSNCRMTPSRAAESGPRSSAAGDIDWPLTRTADLPLLQPPPDPLPDPPHRPLRPPEPGTDLLGREPLQTELDHRALRLVQPSEEPVHSLGQ